MDTPTTWTAEGLNIRNPEGRVVAVAVPTTGEDAGADALVAQMIASALATANESDTVTAAFGHAQDGKIDIINARFSGPGAFDLIQRIGVALKQFEGITTEGIQAMPCGVSELSKMFADMNNDIRAMRRAMALVQIASKDDASWAEFRTGLIKAEEDLAAQRARPN